MNGNIPRELAYLSNLSYLNLAITCQLTGLIPPVLSNLSDLISLKLGRNSS